MRSDLYFTTTRFRPRLQSTSVNDLTTVDIDSYESPSSISNDISLPSITFLMVDLLNVSVSFPTTASVMLSVATATSVNLKFFITFLHFLSKFKVIREDIL